MVMNPGAETNFDSAPVGALASIKDIASGKAALYLGVEPSAITAHAAFGAEVAARGGPRCDREPPVPVNTFPLFEGCDVRPTRGLLPRLALRRLGIASARTAARRDGRCVTGDPRRNHRQSLAFDPQLRWRTAIRARAATLHRTICSLANLAWRPQLGCEPGRTCSGLPVGAGLSQGHPSSAPCRYTDI